MSWKYQYCVLENITTLINSDILQNIMYLLLMYNCLNVFYSKISNLYSLTFLVFLNRFPMTPSLLRPCPSLQSIRYAWNLHNLLKIFITCSTGLMITIIILPSDHSTYFILSTVTWLHCDIIQYINSSSLFIYVYYFVAISQLLHSNMVKNATNSLLMKLNILQTTDGVVSIG